MESNRIELAKQAKREARLAAEAANKEEDLEMPIELQQGSGFPGLAARVRYPAHPYMRFLRMFASPNQVLAGIWDQAASRLSGPTKMVSIGCLVIAVSVRSFPHASFTVSATAP